MLINNSINLRHPRYEASRQKVPKGLYYNFMTGMNAILCEENKYIASTQIGTQTFLEIKGTFEKNWEFTIQNEQTNFWLAFQLLGSSSIKDVDASDLTSQRYIGYFNSDNQLVYQVKSGKVWLLLMGLEVGSTEKMGREWGVLQAEEGCPTKLFSAHNIGYRVKKGLECIQKIKYTPFSCASKLRYHICNLIDTYHGDLLERAKSVQQEDVSLFHRARAYLYENYMNEGIDVQHIADALSVSRRTLCRVFKEKGIAVNAALQTIRIYKGRELLRTTNTSVDLIAFQLQFSTAKYFRKLYIQYFGHTPAAERRLYPPPSKRDDEDLP